MTKVSETQKYDVVIVRAVLSGLQAAQSVQAAGFEVCVLEAIDRFGGKTLTAKSCEKGFNDLGASWINDTNQSEMFKLYQKYGLETEIQRDWRKSFAKQQSLSSWKPRVYIQSPSEDGKSLHRRDV